LLTQEVLDTGAALSFIEREQVTYVAAWPEVTAALTSHPDFPRTDLSHLRGGTLLAGLPTNRRASDPGLVVGSLGMSETCGPHTFAAPGESITGAPEQYRGTFGHPVPGIAHRIVDESGKDLPAGEEGEVLVRGYSLMQGLYKRERSEVLDSDGWYHTGDRGYFRDGWFFFAGRQSAIIKSAGSNVAPAEVERSLMEQPEVRLAFVVGVPHAQRGEDVVALIVASDDDASSIDEADLRARLREQLSSYKIPRHIFVIDYERVPWLVSQKVDGRALGDLADALVAAATSDLLSPG
jgi:acyl-CoA synthetase (AMP-forming)/AMP-acid ligase II